MFCSCYDHQTGKNPRHIYDVLPPGGLLEDVFYVLPPVGYLRTLFVLAPGGLRGRVTPAACPSAGVFQVMYIVYLCMLLIVFPVLLLLDQIKPIGPLVPVN